MEEQLGVNQDLLYRGIKLLLGDLELFSRHVLALPLYNYQLIPMMVVANSVFKNLGQEFLLVFPRQSGKNEAVAQLLVYLLNLLQLEEGNIVYGATGDGMGRGIIRLEMRLDNILNSQFWIKGGRPSRRGLGKASVVFLSTHPGAAARGETAHWLLIIDEMQDQGASHLEAVFEPMRAANNATALYIGTVKSSADALWLKKGELEVLQKEDGLQRVFIVTPEEVVAENEAYGHFLANKVEKLGRRHPIVASEYFNEPIDSQGQMFDHRRLGLMRGNHERSNLPIRRSSEKIFVATLDVGGQDEAATDPLAQLANPGRDYTAAHIFELSLVDSSGPGPEYRALDVFVDHGSRHFQPANNHPPLVDRLLAWLRAWEVSHLIADESGVGSGLVDWLAAKMGKGRVTGYNFASRHGKAGLGSKFLSLIETGRFRYWTGDIQIPLSDGWWFFTQAKFCQHTIPPEGQFERDLRWAVPDSAKVDTPLGRLLVHDDRLISAALVAIYDELIRDGTLRLGQATSAIIKAEDPLDRDKLEF